MLDWKSEHGQIEAQANTFASFLLMPLDDFREQIRGQAITMALMRHLADRYEVSITAAILESGACGGAVQAWENPSQIEIPEGSRWWSPSRVAWARSPTTRLAAPLPIAAPRRR